MRLKGKAALVTGAGAGIGAGIASMFAAEGAAVVVTDIDAAAAERVAAAIVSRGGAALAIQQDVIDEARWPDVMTCASARFGALHVLVNNAGVAPSGDRIEHLSLANWRRTMAINLDAVFLGTKHGILAMKGNGASAGSIVNISSIYGMVGTTGVPDYVASKGAVRLLTKAAALECAESGYPIRVNSVHPGFIETPMLESGLTKMVAAGAFPSVAAGAAALTSLHPIGRLGTPDDVARAAVYLASDESSFMTGAELVIDGGYTAR